MRRPIRLLALSAAVALLASAPPAQAQTEVQTKSECVTFCLATAVACSAASAISGLDPEFCLGMLDGCLYGCTV